MNKRKLIFTAAATGALAGIEGFVLSRYFPPAEKAKAGKKHLVCVGDSITFGAGVLWSRKKSAWPYVLNRLLGDTWQVLNYGVSGTTAQDEADFPYLQRGHARAVMDLQPDATLLMLGTNDSKPFNWNAERYEKNMHKWIRAFNGVSKLIVLLPPKAFPGKLGVVDFFIKDEVIHDEIQPILRRLAEEENVPVIDLYAFTEGHPEYFDDGVHPNVLGNRKIAEFLAEELRNLM